MQEEDKTNPIRNELLERLRALEGPQSTLSDLAYRRAREALERALEEARTIRLQAIEDARSTRERELAGLMESMRSLRQAAESQIDTVLRTTQIEAERLHDRAKAEAEAIIERANNEAAQIRAESAAIRASAEERAREIERVEAAFNERLAEVAQRLGMTEQPSQGWWKRLTGGGK